MKKKMERFSLTTALTATLAISVGSSACSMLPGMRSDLAEMSRSWAEHGVDLSGTNFVVVEPGESFTCGSKSSEHTVVGDGGLAEYCTREDAIVVALGPYEELVAEAATKGISEQAFGRFLMAHELGHRIQDVTGRIDRPSDVIEPEADCLAGVTYGRLYPPEVIAEAEQVFAEYSYDVSEFRLGHQTGSC